MATTSTSLADQLALAIDNARLFTETQLTVKELDELNKRLVTQAWRPYQAHIKSVFMYDRLGVKPVTETSTSSNLPGQSHQLSLPIQFRNQSIGSITLERAQDQADWTASEIDLFKTVVNQLGLSLENQRMLEDMQRRSVQERLISDITARLWASSDITTIVRTAAQEIGSSFEVCNAVIQLEIPTQYTVDGKH